MWVENVEENVKEVLGGLDKAGVPEVRDGGETFHEVRRSSNSKLFGVWKMESIIHLCKLDRIIYTDLLALISQ